MGYSGWDEEQLKHEIEENTWIVGQENYNCLLNIETSEMWKEVLCMQGGKYNTWARFPQIPLMN